jgi:hypothetical protein
MRRSIRTCPLKADTHNEIEDFFNRLKGGKLAIFNLVATFA